MSLENLRSELSAVDRQLVELIAERQRIVGEIGRSKQSAGRATRDYEREKEVLDNARRHARSLNVDPNIAEEILSTLIRSSLTHQERDRVVAEGKGDGRSVLVIGGAGKMGGWFVDFFKSQGFATTIADTTAADSPASFSDWRVAGVDYDIIVVATPMAVSGAILTELATLAPAGLVFDIGSLKTPAEIRTERAGAGWLQSCFTTSDVRTGYRTIVGPAPDLRRRRLAGGDSRG